MINKLIVLLLSAGLAFLPPADTMLTSSKGELVANVPITVSEQQAVYEKWTLTKVTCGVCSGSGRVPSYRKCTACYGAGDVNCSNFDCPFGGGWHACDVCKGSGQLVSGQIACYSCSGSGKIDGKGALVSDVTATSGSLPSNGKHADGYWYVFKENVED